MNRFFRLSPVLRARKAQEDAVQEALGGVDDSTSLYVERGYRLRDMTRLKKGGSYAMATAMVVLPTPYTPGDEATALAMLDEPLEVDARPLSPP